MYNIEYTYFYAQNAWNRHTYGRSYLQNDCSRKYSKKQNTRE